MTGGGSDAKIALKEVPSLKQGIGGSIKDPEQEAENPAPMPEANQRNRVSQPKERDPEGQQGSHRLDKGH